jgi:hypothetical protein
MSKRITVVLDDGVIKKLHILQAKKIKKSSKSVSFSSVIYDILSEKLDQI